MTDETAELGFRQRRFFVDVQNRGFHVAILNDLFLRVLPYQPPTYGELEHCLAQRPHVGGVGARILQHLAHAGEHPVGRVPVGGQPLGGDPAAAVSPGAVQHHVGEGAADVRRESQIALGHAECSVRCDPAQAPAGAGWGASPRRCQRLDRSPTRTMIVSMPAPQINSAVWGPTRSTRKPLSSAPTGPAPKNEKE